MRQTKQKDERLAYWKMILEKCRAELGKPGLSLKEQAALETIEAVSKKRVEWYLTNTHPV